MGSSLAEMQGKTVYIRPKVVGPFPGPTQAGATCTGLPFLKMAMIDYMETNFDAWNTWDEKITPGIVCST